MSVDTTTDAFLREVLADEPEYPKGTVFIDAQSDRLVQSMADAMYEGRVFVLVFSNRQERVFTPASGWLGRLGARLLWPTIYKDLLAELERARKPLRRRRRPDKAAPKRLRGGHYAYDSPRTRITASHSRP